MKCVDSQNLIMKFFDRELNDIEEAQLKQHLKTCKKCSENFNSLKEIFNIVEQDPGIEPPEDFEAQVMYRITNEEKVYTKHSDINQFVYNILLTSISLILVTFFAGTLLDFFRTPFNVMELFNSLIDGSRDFIISSISMLKGILIAIVSVATSIYKTYYFEYIILAILFAVTQGVFIKMVRQSSNGGTQ